jgi:hypothetical protein
MLGCLVGFFLGGITQFAFHRPWPWLGPLVAGFTFQLAYILPSAHVLRRRQTILECQDDAEVLGPVRPDEREVGVSYSRSIAMEGLRCWDRGRLRWDAGALCFRGYGPSFALPPGYVTNVTVAWTGRSKWMDRPVAVVEWRHPEGTAECVCFEARPAHARNAERALCQSLANWIADGCRAASHDPAPFDPALLPFRSTEADEAATVRSRRTPR